MLKGRMNRPFKTITELNTAYLQVSICFSAAEMPDSE